MPEDSYFFLSVTRQGTGKNEENIWVLPKNDSTTEGSFATDNPTTDYFTLNAVLHLV